MLNKPIPLYGPLSIQPYGVFIVIGVILFIFLIEKNKRFTTLKLQDSFYSVVAIGIIVGLLGGKALYLISEEPSHLFSLMSWLCFWEGGLSILGAVAAIPLIIPLCLKYYEIPVLPFLDLVAIYAPLIQSISRIGCFFAGCCYGLPSSSFYAVTYTELPSQAPLYISLHPTQLYSSFLLFVIFLFMFYILQYKLKVPGQLFTSYIMLVSMERFIVDFWRQKETISTYFISFNQYVALILFIVAFALFWYYTKRIQSSQL